MSAAKRNNQEQANGSDSDDDFQYEEVSVEDDWSVTEGEEDLEATVKAIQTRTEASAGCGTEQPDPVDVFLRNFLSQMGMQETLERFQTEWTEMKQKGQLDTELVGVVPNCYIKNQRLDSELRNAQREMEQYRLAASAAAETLVKAQRARDFHRMQHKRVVQEKNMLIEKIKKAKDLCSNYEPGIKRLNEKHQALLRQTMMVTLEKDKVLGQASQHGTVPPPYKPSSKDKELKGDRKSI